MLLFWQTGCNFLFFLPGNAGGSGGEELHLFYPYLLLQDIPGSEQVFKGVGSEKLIDTSITKEIMEQEIDKLKKIQVTRTRRNLSQSFKRMQRGY